MRRIALHPCPEAEQHALGLDDGRILGFEELDEIEGPLYPTRPRVHAIEREARVQPAESLLASQPPDEAPDVVLEVVVDRELVTQRPERHEHLEVRDNARRHRQPLIPDRLEDLDGQLR